MAANKKNIAKKTADILMTVLLLCLMAYQVTGEELHEWFGVGMTVLLIVHHILNIRWYGSLFRGRYTPFRVITTAVNTLLLASIALTAVCGMAMSAHAVPFMYGILPAAFARRFHLAMSYWSFILMGVHLGLHVPVMAAGMRLGEKTRTAAAAVSAVISGVGLWLFVGSGIPGYIFFKVPFAFFDYDKPAVLVFAENLAMLIAFAFIGSSLASLSGQGGRDGKRKEKRLVTAVLLLAAALICAVLLLLPVSGGKSEPWAAPSPASSQSGGGTGTATGNTASSDYGGKDYSAGSDGFVLIPGGSFMMGSPDIVELTPVIPYSDDYSTVLMEAQEEQHVQARPELNEHIDDMDGCDTILLGYPNWWASIPMPIATFLESCDFSGKTIIPFCSHGGGRFGQSLTAISKLAPDAVIGEGLSVHYSGGSTLAEDVAEWLDGIGVARG